MSTLARKLHMPPRRRKVRNAAVDASQVPSSSCNFTQVAPDGSVWYESWFLWSCLRSQLMDSLQNLHSPS